MRTVESAAAASTGTGCVTTGMTRTAATGATGAQRKRRIGHSTVSASLTYRHAIQDADRLLDDRFDRVLTEPAAPVLAFEPRAFV